MTIREAIAEASTHIARRDAETLLLHLLSRDRAWLMAHSDEPIDEAAHTQLRELTTRRAAREPLQQITGVQEFYGFPLKVTRDTLIPRPETELLVEAVLNFARTQTQPLRILDIGTGTGAIALALASHLPDATIIACDISPAALAVARENAASLNLRSRINFIESDLLAAVSTVEPFDIIASNPPYIPIGDASAMHPEVRDFEPHTALFSGPDGLDIYRRLIPEAQAGLRSSGLLALEFGFGQRDSIHKLLAHWSDVRFLDDYASIPRIALAIRP